MDRRIRPCTCGEPQARYTNTSTPTNSIYNKLSNANKHFKIIADPVGGRFMVEAMLIDLKALLVEREECNAGTVQKIREALAQGKTQYRTLRDVTEILKKKAETAAPGQAKNWHLKLGIASFFLGHLGEAVTHLKQAEG